VDFAVRYTEQQTGFRRVVRDWLTENVPPAVVGSDEHFEDLATYQARRQLGRLLGRRGWLYPMSPAELGGGGLGLDSALVISEELGRFGLDLPPYYDSGGVLGSAAILRWGSEAQKRRLLPPIFRGEQRTWQLLTEPGAGSDLAAVSTTARNEGDHYVLNGQKVFVGSLHGADAMWTIVRTGEPDDRHHNLAWFMLDARLPGITVQPQHLIGGIDKNTVFLDDVRVPTDNLVGGENRGWEVASTHLDHEHGLRSDRVLGRKLDELWSVVAGRARDHATADPVMLDTLAQLFVRKEVVRLLGIRNYWLTMEGSPRTYEGSQGYLMEKTATQWAARALLDAFGPAALTDADQHPSSAALVVQQTLGVLSMHGGGTGEIQRMLIARHLGLGRKATAHRPQAV